MRVLLKKTSNGWIPADKKAQEFFDKCKLGSTHYCDIKAQRTDKAHRAFYAFIQDVMENQDIFTDKDNFINYLCSKTGFGVWDVGKDPENGQEIFVFHKKSFKFKKTDQNKFVEEANKIYAVIEQLYGINFKECLAMQRDRKCQFPDCENTAVHVHHIFPGTARREICERHNLKVETCQHHHDLSHGIGPDINDKEKTQKEMQRIWCEEALQINYEAAVHLVFI